MNSNKKIKTLWVDDHIDKLKPFVDKLKAEGFDVTTELNTESAIELCKKVQFDLIIADIRMEPIDGIAFLRKIDSLQLKAGRAMITSFLYLQKYSDRIQALDFFILPIEKPLPNYESDNFIKFVIEPLKMQAKAGRQSRINGKIIDTVPQEEIEPFSISFNDFIGLTINEKDKYSRLAIKLAKKTISDAFAEGKVWVLLCGSPNVIRIAVDDIKKIPKESTILEFAENLELAPYQVAKGLSTETMWTSCNIKESQLDDYPTVTLKIKNKGITAHFDTGSPTTFFSYEEIVHFGALRPSNTFIYALREGFERMYEFTQMENIPSIIVCQNNNQTTKILLNGQAIRDWNRSPFAKKCTQICRLKEYYKEIDDVCPLRHALVGRTLLTDNGLKVILDGENKKTVLMPKCEE